MPTNYQVKIDIHIANKDRPTELFGLLQSLRTQSYQNFDVVILDDGSGTNIQSYYFLQYIINRMKCENHNVVIIRNDIPSGVSRARQQLIDWSLKNSKAELLCRIDDDSILDINYLDKLLEVIDTGYDVASGVVPHFGSPETKRDIKFVEPIIGYCQMNAEGSLIANFDDCGYTYTEEKILPSPHFRSCAMFKREIFENGISYDNRLSKNGFREEQWLSFLIISKGYKIGCNTGAIAWHQNTPSGGERDTMNLGAFNQQQFDIFVKRLFEEKGDFLAKYYKDIDVYPKRYTKGELLKSINLVNVKEDINLLE